MASSDVEQASSSPGPFFRDAAASATESSQSHDLHLDRSPLRHQCWVAARPLSPASAAAPTTASNGTTDAPSPSLSLPHSPSPSPSPSPSSHHVPNAELATPPSSGGDGVSSGIRVELHEDRLESRHGGGGDGGGVGGNDSLISRSHGGSQSLPRDLPGGLLQRLPRHDEAPDSPSGTPCSTISSSSKPHEGCGGGGGGGPLSCGGSPTPSNPSPMHSPLGAKSSAASSPLNHPPTLRVIGPYSGPAIMMSSRVFPPPMPPSGMGCLPSGSGHGCSPSGSPAVSPRGGRAPKAAGFSANGLSPTDLASAQKRADEHRAARLNRSRLSFNAGMSPGSLSGIPGLSPASLSPTSAAGDAAEIAAYCPLASSSSFGRSTTRSSSFGSGRLSPVMPPEPLRLGPLVQALAEGSTAKIREAARSVRAALKGCKENKDRLMAACGIEPLVRALNVADDAAVEHAATALFNVCREDGAAEAIATAGGLEALVRVLDNGCGSAEDGSVCEGAAKADEKVPAKEEQRQLPTAAAAAARENAAAALFCLASVSPTYRDRIAAAGAIPPLAQLLRDASLRGKKDAALALFALTRAPGGAQGVVDCGGVRTLLDLLQAGEPGVEEKAMAVLAAVAKLGEGQEAIKREEGSLLTLVEVLELSSQRAREDAVVTLLLLCASDREALRVVSAEGVVPAVRKLCRSESKRASEKAKALLELLAGVPAAGGGGGGADGGGAGGGSGAGAGSSAASPAG